MGQTPNTMKDITDTLRAMAKGLDTQTEKLQQETFLCALGSLEILKLSLITLYEDQKV